MTRKQQFIPFVMMLVAVVLALLTAAATKAQTIATVTTDLDTITVGEPVRLTVSVTHPEDSLVLFPELEPNWGNLVVRGQSAPTTTSNGDGTAVTRQQIDVRLFAPGNFQTSPLALTISDNAGNLSETVAEPISLTVTSILKEGDTELRDIKPQAELPLPKIWPTILVGLVTISALAAFVIWKRRSGKLFIDNRLPHEKALAALAEIDRQKYASNGRYKELYTAVSNTLRTYFEAIGDIPMTDRTTAEIRRDLADEQFKQTIVLCLLSILEVSDLVKFANVQPSQHEAGQLTRSARQLILDTRPQPVAEDTDKKSGPKSTERKRQKQMEVAA